MAMHVVGTCGGKRAIATFSAAAWLHLAAAPAFAIMALFIGLPEGGPNDILCRAARTTSLFGGMAWMYVLMSIFHSAPWLNLIAGRQRGAGPS